MSTSVSDLWDAESEREKDQKRIERVLRLEINFIDSDEFESMLAAKAALGSLDVVPSKRPRTDRFASDADQLACLAPALNEPLLTFAEEQHEFRRMNFLKFSAARIRSKLNPQRPSRKKLEEIERCLTEATSARDHIIRANLRLVIANARKYRSAKYEFEDLVSDGSLSLMEAVDKFDYQRGFRFSTYATHAIRRSFFRKMERKQKDRLRFVVTDPEVMSSAPDRNEVNHDAPAQIRLIERMVNSLPEHLTKRELHIVEGRFGLNDRSQTSTLMELSGELGICKERVRQVEGVALQKLQALALNFSKLPNEILELAFV